MNEEFKYINKMLSLSDLGFTVYPEPYYEVLDDSDTECTEIIKTDGETNQF